MLRQQPNLGEVNYWALSAGSFRALEMFLFKLHAPRPFNPTDWGAVATGRGGTSHGDGRIWTRRGTLSSMQRSIH